MNLKPIDFKILSELVKNSKISDRKLSKVLDVSQPTVTRRRARLEKLGLLDYTAFLNFPKLGFKILAFTFSRWKHRDFPDEKVEEGFAVMPYAPWALALVAVSKNEVPIRIHGF